MIRFVVRSLVALMLVCALTLVALLVVAVEDTPLVDAPAPPTPEQVAQARSFVRNLRDVAGRSSAEETVLHTNVTELNSAMQLGNHLLEGMRGQVLREGGEIRGVVSLPVPWGQKERWINVSGRVPPFEDGLTLSEVRVGPINVPPKLALQLARIGGNALSRGDLGNRVISAADAMFVDADGLRFRMDLGRMGQNGIMRDMIRVVRDDEMPAVALIESYHNALRTAMAEGTLPRTGSILPHIRFVLMSAQARGGPDNLSDHYTAAIFGLATACGAPQFAGVIKRLGIALPEPGTDARCDALTLNDRRDSRLHFVTSAALQAASNRNVAVSIGEFKELYDTISGSGGFDFTDMAANLSGVRMSDMLMQDTPQTWERRLERLQSEADLIVAFDGLPGKISKEEFAARFGTVDSPEYIAMIAEIDARIDRLDFYRP